MTSHDLLTIILSIGIPMLIGFGWIIVKLLSIQKEVGDAKNEIQKDIRCLDVRIAHMEGYLIGKQSKTGI